MFDQIRAAGTHQKQRGQYLGWLRRLVRLDAGLPKGRFAVGGLPVTVVRAGRYGKSPNFLGGEREWRDFVRGRPPLYWVRFADGTLTCVRSTELEPAPASRPAENVTEESAHA